MSDKPYAEPLGGSYVVDEATGSARRVGGTEEPKGARPRPVDLDRAAKAQRSSPDEAGPAAKKGK